MAKDEKKMNISMLDGRLMAMAPNHSKTIPVGLLGDEVPPPPREPKAVTVTLKGKDRRGRPGGGRQLPRLRPFDAADGARPLRRP
jgi:hypothetical protein